MSSDLVLVEASGKIENLRKKLKAIGIRAEVMATVGHLADNPRALDKIALDEQLRELQYKYKPERAALIEKIGRAAMLADRVYLAMDDDHEGDVIAWDLAQCLPEHADKLLRVRLRALSENELKSAFDNAQPATSASLQLAANNGICRRIIDRAIGATFSQVAGTTTIPVGRVQSSLLASIAKSPPQIGEFVMEARVQGELYRSIVPVYQKNDCEVLARIAERVATGESLENLSVTQEAVARSTPWGFEEIVAEASERLRIGVEEAADAFQEAYMRGKVTYPRVRKNGYTQDAVEVALALARHNRTLFDGAMVPMRGTDGLSGMAHESPRPVDDEMSLGRALTLLDTPDALAVLVARNMIECGQQIMTKKMRVEIEERELLFVYTAKPPSGCWKDAPVLPGYRQFGRDYAILRYMADVDLGRASTVVSHVTKILQRGVINDDGLSLGLNRKGMQWVEHARAAGMTEATSRLIEKALSGPLENPHTAARDILARLGLLVAVQERIKTQKVVVFDENTSELSF